MVATKSDRNRNILRTLGDRAHRGAWEFATGSEGMTDRNQQTDEHRGDDLRDGATQSSRSSTEAGAGAATDGAGQVSGERGGGGEPVNAPSAVPSAERAREIFSAISAKSSGERDSREAAVIEAYNRIYAELLREDYTPTEASSEAQVTAVQRVWRDNIQQKNSSSDSGVIGSSRVAELAAAIGLEPRDLSVGVPEVLIPPLPVDFRPDRAVLVLRSGPHVVSFDVTAHQLDADEIDVGDFNETVRFVLWGMRHGMRLPDPAVSKVVRSELCPACGARPHFQDPRLADPAIEALVKGAVV